MRTRLQTLAVLLTSVLALSACGGSEAAPSGSAAEHGGGHGSSSPAAEGGAAEGNAADVAFLQGMTPHHEQAVEMSEIVLAADPPAEVAALATRIKDAQDPEIAQMKDMLRALGASAAGGHGGHGGGHGGMLSDADMSALRAARGAEAARLYLEGMIEHHRGAIEASEAQIEDGAYGPAVELAEQIAADQAAEIAVMERMLTQL